MQTMFGTHLNPLNLSEAARITGYSRSTLSRWKKHPEQMTVRALVILADATRITDGELINIIRSMKWE